MKITQETFQKDFNGSLSNLINKAAGGVKDGRESIHKPKFTHPFVVGIDAGVHTGIAVWDSKTEKFIFLVTGTFWTIYHLIVNFHKPESTLIVIERPKKGFAYPQRQGGNSRQVREMIAFKSGENNRESSLLVDEFERLGYTVQKVTPTTGKWSKEDLRAYTGITDRTNEHVRDAIKLIWAG